LKIYPLIYNDYGIRPGNDGNTNSVKRVTITEIYIDENKSLYRPAAYSNEPYLIDEFGIETLKFGDNYNNSIILNKKSQTSSYVKLIPSTVKTIKFGHSFNQKLGRTYNVNKYNSDNTIDRKYDSKEKYTNSYLPEKLNKLTLGTNFNEDIGNNNYCYLPNALT
jgi:hypothetical protein